MYNYLPIILFTNHTRTEDVTYEINHINVDYVTNERLELSPKFYSLILFTVKSP